MHLFSLFISWVKHHYEITDLYEVKSQKNQYFFSTSNDIRGDLYCVCTDIYLYTSASMSCDSLLFLYWNRNCRRLMQWKNYIPWLFFCLSDFFTKLKSSNVNSKSCPENRLYHSQIQFNMLGWAVLYMHMKEMSWSPFGKHCALR